MLGFWVVNLLPPGSPLKFDLRTPSGTWEVEQGGHFATVVNEVVQNGACANMYSMVFRLPTDGTRNTVKDAAFLEVLPICLAASFVTGAAVTIRDCLPASEVTFISVGSHFPRARGIPAPQSCVNTLDEFIRFVERFVDQYSQLNPSEKLLLLIHFYVDACSCWSLENLYLSGSTLLQIIADTEKATGRGYATSHAVARLGKSDAKPAFFDYIAGAADRVGITMPSHDVVKIRNSLIHEGTLNKKPFLTQADAAVPIAEAMRWVGDYVYAILKIGPVPSPRHLAQDFANGVNSFSFS